MGELRAMAARTGSENCIEVVISMDYNNEVCVATGVSRSIREMSLEERAPASRKEVAPGRGRTGSSLDVKILVKIT